MILRSEAPGWYSVAFNQLIEKDFDKDLVMLKNEKLQKSKQMEQNGVMASGLVVEAVVNIISI